MSSPTCTPVWQYFYDDSVKIDQAFFLVYWVAPIVGTVAGTIIWKLLEPKSKPKTD